ncbi:acyl carrier protein [Sulfurimonas sp. HSL3-7]|uniref:acyl carrier protein n=1 Tax=Sulfonitrofixus jiaomeiensis TaxID=3131938 RepID=UPI0031F81DB3
MTKEEIKQTIIEQIVMVAPDIEEEEIEPSANLQRSLEIDSFDFLKVLTALNEKLGVDVPETDYAQVDTLEHMTDYFEARL